MTTIQDLEYDLSLARTRSGKPIYPRDIAKIMQYVKSPNEESWSDIHAIIITQDTTSDANDCINIWRAVGMFDPTFPRTRLSDDFGHICWSRIPTGEMVCQAIRMVTH